jgi:hypothetical protein
MKTVDYYPQEEKASAHQLMLAVSNSVLELFVETDFREYFPKSGRYSWSMFEEALEEALNSFQNDLEIIYFVDRPTRRPSKRSYERTGFSGASLRFKIAFWNELVERYNRERQERGPGFRILKKIIQKVLDFINIILGSAGLLTGNDGLDEMKKLGEWIIVDAIPDDEV